MTDIETNRMYSWSDMSEVKKNLWKKLHAVKNAMNDQVTNLAQVLATKLPTNMKNALLQLIKKPKRENPLMLSQVSNGIPTTKQVNTKGTLLLYFCIITVLLFFCLGRCLVVPLSQASKFEIN